MTLHRHALPLWLFVLSVLVACSSGSGEPTGQTTSALTLTPTTARILGFEQATDWSGSSGTSTTRSEGARSVKVTGDGWKQIESLPFGPVGAIGPTLKLDVRLPVELPYWGDVRAIAKVPSAGVWWQELAPVSIQGLAPNQFHTLTFSLPAQLASQIGAASDAVFIIAVNAPAGTYLVDNLRLSEPQGGASGTTGGTGTTGSGGGGGSGGSGGSAGTGATSGGSGATGGSGGTAPQPGSLGPATADGSFDGEAIPVAGAFGILRSTPHPQVTVAISSHGDACGVTQAKMQVPGEWFLYLSLLRVSGNLTAPIGPETYDLTALTEGVFAGARLSRADTNCDESLTHDTAESGQITLTEVGSSLVRGSYSVTFPNDVGVLSGTFVAPTCAVPAEPEAVSCGTQG